VGDVDEDVDIGDREVPLVDGDGARRRPQVRDLEGSVGCREREVAGGGRVENQAPAVEFPGVATGTVLHYQLPDARTRKVLRPRATVSLNADGVRNGGVVLRDELVRCGGAGCAEQLCGDLTIPGVVVDAVTEMRAAHARHQPVRAPPHLDGSGQQHGISLSR